MVMNIFRRKKSPKIEIPHRVRKNGWIKCECQCECSDMSRWEDNLCINCFRGRHRNNYKPSEVNKKQ